MGARVSHSRSLLVTFEPDTMECYIRRSFGWRFPRTELGCRQLPDITMATISISLEMDSSNSRSCHALHGYEHTVTTKLNVALV